VLVIAKSIDCPHFVYLMYLWQVFILSVQSYVITGCMIRR